MKKQQSGFTVIEVVLVIVVISALAGAGALVLSRRNRTPSPVVNNTVSHSATTASTANSGTCFGVSKATIKTLLGAPAVNLQDLSDTGVKDIGKGDTARTCVYTFAPGATVVNSFSMDVGTYANQANLDASQKYVTTAGASVSGLGDSATYQAKDAALSNSRDFALMIHQDLKIYTFDISQPLNALTYNDASAQRVLIQIAQAATL